MQRCRPNLFGGRWSSYLVLIIAIGSLCEAEVWGNVSSGDNFSYTLSSEWSGSGFADGSATASSSKASVLRIQPTVNEAATVFKSVAVDQANTSTSVVGDPGKYAHWTLLLTGIETLAYNKTLDRERFRL